MINETLMNKENHKKCVIIIKSIIDRRDSYEFRGPVDFITLKLDDYPIVITKPMDLGTCMKNLKTALYKTVEDCLNDLQLIWDNCKLYNSDHSKIHKVAVKLEEATRKLVRDYFPDIKSYGTRNPNLEALNRDVFIQFDQLEEVPYQEKVRISQKVRKLTKEQLGELVKMIEENCVQAFKESDKDICHIFVDNIPKSYFTKVANFVDEHVNDDISPIKKLKR